MALFGGTGCRIGQDLQAAAKALGMAGGAGASRLLALLYDPEVAIDRVLVA